MSLLKKVSVSLTHAYLSRPLNLYLGIIWSPFSPLTVLIPLSIFSYFIICSAFNVYFTLWMHSSVQDLTGFTHAMYSVYCVSEHSFMLLIADKMHVVISLLQGKAVYQLLDRLIYMNADKTE